MIKIIAAVSKNGVIGRNNDLIFKDKEDMKHFRKITMNKWCIMGRKTWESIGSKPLKGRDINVITNSPDLLGKHWGQPYVDLDTLMAVYEDPFVNNDLYVLGGGELYRQTIGIADELIISEFPKFATGNIFFPEIDLKVWELKEEKPFTNFTLKTYIRIKNEAHD